MRKTTVLVFCVLLVTSAGSAQLIPSDMTIDLNINLFGGDSGEGQESQQQQNRTYGRQVDGQAVHTETGDNDPGVQRNTQEYGITEKDTNEEDDFMQSVSAFFHGLFGTGNGPDTSEPNSVT